MGDINKKPDFSRALFCFGGEGGIRTRDTVTPYTDFPGLLFQPLRHLSVLRIAKVVIQALRSKCF